MSIWEKVKNCTSNYLYGDQEGTTTEGSHLAASTKTVQRKWAGLRFEQKIEPRDCSLLKARLFREL